MTIRDWNSSDSETDESDSETMPYGEKCYQHHPQPSAPPAESELPESHENVSFAADASKNPSPSHEMNQLNKETSPDRPPPDLIRNLPSPEHEAEDDKQDTKTILLPRDQDKQRNKELNLPWTIQSPGELIDVKDTYDKKKKRRRQLKRAAGWAFWAICPPLALLCNALRDAPVDQDDLCDDPLRPWCYKIKHRQ